MTGTTIMNIGDRFGSWVITNENPISKNGQGYFYECKCSCGTIKYVRSNYLRYGKSLNCGCKNKLSPVKNNLRFNSKYIVDSDTDCWNWVGNYTRGGYGTFFFMGKNERAHRVSYKINVGTIPDGMLVCHKCDNPKCVNPKHLFLGTHFDNNADMHVKGRAPKSNPKVAGTLNKISKLKDSDIVKIRNLAHQGVSKAEIGRIFNIRDSHVCKIVSRQSWRHIV